MDLLLDFRMIYRLDLVNASNLGMEVIVVRASLDDRWGCAIFLITVELPQSAISDDVIAAHGENL